MLRDAGYLLWDLGDTDASPMMAYKSEVEVIFVKMDIFSRPFLLHSSAFRLLIFVSKTALVWAEPDPSISVGLNV